MTDAPSTDGTPHRPLTLLVADDEELIRKAVVRLFERRGHTVHVADCAQQALDLAGEHDFDAVLVDQNMPGSGLHVLDSLLGGQAFGGLAILMTGGADSGEVESLPGKVRRLQKPFRFGEVVPMVEHHFTD